MYAGCHQVVQGRNAMTKTCTRVATILVINRGFERLNAVKEPLNARTCAF